jgi:HK97 gp10 family phage protein
MPNANFSVKIDDAKLQSLIRTSPSKASNLVNAMALDGDAYVVRSFTVSPSAPGEPPGVDTGALKNSIHVEKTGEFSRAIVTGTEYAAHLEFGTENMAARPFMGPMAAYLQRHVMDYWRTFVE